METSKAAALHSSALNSTKADPTATSAPGSASLEDTDLKKVLEKCKRQQAELEKLAEENRQLKVKPSAPLASTVLCVLPLQPSSVSRRMRPLE